MPLSPLRLSLAGTNSWEAPVWWHRGPDWLTYVLTVSKNGKFSQPRSLHGIDPCRLDQLPSITTPDERAPARRLRTRAQVAEDRPLFPVAGHQEAGHVELAQSLDHRLEQGPAETTDPPGEDQVQADVAGLRQKVEQFGDRVVSRLGDQVVVIDHHEQIRTPPPTAVAQLVRGHVGAGQPGRDRLADRRHRLGQ